MEEESCVSPTGIHRRCFRRGFDRFVKIIRSLICHEDHTPRKPDAPYVPS